MEHRTIASGPIHSSCSTMGWALRRPDFGNNYQRFELVERRLVAECAYAVSVNPIFGMEYHFSSHSCVPYNSDHCPFDNHLKAKVRVCVFVCMVNATIYKK